MRVAAFVACVWLACAPLTFGMMNADFRAEFRPDAVARGYWDGRKNCGASMAFTMAGPISLIVVFFLSGFAEQGLSYRCD